MFDLTALAVAAFATFRAAELLCVDDGPGNIFFNLRLWAGVYDSENSEHKPASFIGRLLDCPYCMGVWIAIPFAVWLAPSLLCIPVWLAIAGGQALLQKIGGRTT